jgi:hypothetical protein
MLIILGRFFFVTPGLKKVNDEYQLPSASFALMERLSIPTALTFDPHYKEYRRSPVNPRGSYPLQDPPGEAGKDRLFFREGDGGHMADIKHGFPAARSKSSSRGDLGKYRKLL